MNFNDLIMFVGVECAVALLLLIIMLVLIILRSLRKTVVTVTVVSVEAEAASYDHGDTVNIKGAVTIDADPQPGVTVSLKVKDSADNEYNLPDVTTDEDGKFSAAWIIPFGVAPGVCRVSATARYITVTTTFTLE